MYFVVISLYLNFLAAIYFNKNLSSFDYNHYQSISNICLFRTKSKQFPSHLLSATQDLYHVVFWCLFYFDTYYKTVSLGVLNSVFEKMVYHQTIESLYDDVMSYASLSSSGYWPLDRVRNKLQVLNVQIVAKIIPIFLKQ